MKTSKNLRLQRPILFVILVLATSAECRPQTGRDNLKLEYEAAKTTLKPHFDGFSIDNDPGAPGLLDREWTLLSRWVERYLDENPSASPNEIRTALGNLDSSLNVDSLRLDEHAYV